MLVGSFIFFLLVFVAIGAASALANKGSSEDYLLASSSLKPWLVALSAVATNNSGWMFVGLIGFTATAGLQAFWVMFGFIVGDFIMSFVAHKQLRIATDRTKALSFAGVLSKWNGDEQNYLRKLSGFITILFLGTYAAAQLGAGSKALHVLLGWDYQTGAIIGAVIVVIYCWAGGIRASVWTDAAQSVVMIVSMGTMLFLSLNAAGGIENFTSGLNAIDPSLLSLWPDKNLWGITLFIIGWLFAGAGIVGQPHVMVRFMMMEHQDSIKHVRMYYYSWYTVFSLMAIGVGFCARLLLPFEDGFDSELSLPLLAKNIMHPATAGLTLAGLFAATMSTADSQIISCSASATRDFNNGQPFPYWATKLATVIVTSIALLIALFANETVFSLVLIAWSALGAAFGPLLIVLAVGQKPKESLSIAMALTGLVTVIIWKYYGLNDITYGLLPGMVLPLLVFAAGKKAGLTLKS